MKAVSMEDVAANLSDLVDQAATGNCFLITKDGVPLVKVVPCDLLSAIEAHFEKPPAEMKRLGFMAGEFEVPDDFDTM